MSFEISNFKNPLAKYNKSTITLVIAVLNFWEIDHEGSIIDFQVFQILWLLKKIMSLSEKIDLQFLFSYHKKEKLF